MPAPTDRWIPTPRSSALAGYHYLSQLRILIVDLRSGARYAYADVPARVVQELARADSAGRYYTAHIRDRFTTARVPKACDLP